MPQSLTSSTSLLHRLAINASARPSPIDPSRLPFLSPSSFDLDLLLGGTPLSQRNLHLQVYHRPMFRRIHMRPQEKLHCGQEPSATVLMQVRSLRRLQRLLPNLSRLPPHQHQTMRLPQLLPRMKSSGHPRRWFDLPSFGSFTLWC
jgi:hypothetical protein